MNRRATAPTGVRFTEEMGGHVSFGEEDHERGARQGRETGTRLMFRLTIEVDDLDRFAADARRAAGARGWVRCEALGGRLPVERGAFNLFVDDHDPARKRMLYRLFFRDGVGRPLTLSGFKVVGGRPGIGVWRDTTTLYVRVLGGHVGEGDEPGAEVVASGVLRLRPWGFARQLATFRGGGATRRARAAAIRRFGALFLGQLWQAYGGRFAVDRRVVAGVRRELERRKPR
jgi:cholesterol oxidase